MRLFLAFFLTLVPTAECIPGQKLVSRIKQAWEKRRPRINNWSKRNKIVSKHSSGAGTCDAPRYPAGALPLLEAATDLFTKTFGAAPMRAAHAPGRVNLIGEHTDYTGGFVLPLALEKRTVVVGSGAVVDVASDAALCQVLSLGIDGPLVAFDADPTVLVPGEPSWANYVKGVVAQYSADLPAGKKFAFRAVFASDVPLGAGLSSSAALEVSTATLLEQLDGYPRGAEPTGAAKAVRCQMAEHEFCGMPCGIMDQFISTLGQEGHLLQIDCRTNVGTSVAIASGAGIADVVIVVANSNVKHALTGSEYPTRVAQCKAATIVLAASHPEVSQLRDATVAMVEAARGGMDDETFRRARHVVSENDRVLAAVAALEAGNFPAAGKLMAQSHASLRDDFEVRGRGEPSRCDVPEATTPPRTPGTSLDYHGSASPALVWPAPLPAGELPGA